MLPYMIYYILSFILAPSPQLSMYNNVTRGILYISHGTSLFIYIAFNKLFRQILLGYLKFK